VPIDASSPRGRRCDCNTHRNRQTAVAELGEIIMFASNARSRSSFIARSSLAIPALVLFAIACSPAPRQEDEALSESSIEPNDPVQDPAVDAGDQLQPDTVGLGLADEGAGCTQEAADAGAGAAVDGGAPKAPPPVADAGKSTTPPAMIPAYRTE